MSLKITLSNLFFILIDCKMATLTFTMWNGLVGMKATTFAFCLSALILAFAVAGRGISQENAVSDVDILAYSVFNYGDGTTIYTYDTSNDENKTLYQSDDRLHFTFGSDGRIAFSTGWIWKNNGEVFVLDTTKSDQHLVNLSDELDMVGYPLGWSDDGNYLAFASEIGGGQKQAIYIWDGTITIDITPQNMLGNPQSFDIAWSPDGRLAFTVWFGSSNRDPRSEIYIWDGETTFNLSQNEESEDREPNWNTSGELAFGSTLDNQYTLLLWDGVSYVDDVPDVSSFTRIAPQLHVFSPFSTWVGDDLLAFEGVDPEDSLIQIYNWDGQTWSNISQIPDAYSYAPQWSHDGYWAFITDQQRIYVRNEQNDTIFETQGRYGPVWSSGGSLIFCNREGRGAWNLSRWDRTSVSTLAQGDVIYAQWRSGQSIVCSDG